MKNIVLILLLTLSSCATHYNATGYRGGYSEIKIDNNTYEVSFKGNGYTNSETIKKYFLYRCAELTIEKGYEYFVFMDKDVSSSKIVSGHDGDISTTTKTSGNGIIKMYAKKPDGDIVYNAPELQKELEPYINRGKNSLL